MSQDSNAPIEATKSQKPHRRKGATNKQPSTTDRQNKRQGSRRQKKSTGKAKAQQAARHKKTPPKSPTAKSPTEQKRINAARASRSRERKQSRRRRRRKLERERERKNHAPYCKHPLPPVRVGEGLRGARSRRKHNSDSHMAIENAPFFIDLQKQSQSTDDRSTDDRDDDVQTKTQQSTMLPRMDAQSTGRNAKSERRQSKVGVSWSACLLFSDCQLIIYCACMLSGTKANSLK